MVMKPLSEASLNVFGAGSKKDAMLSAREADPTVIF